MRSHNSRLAEVIGKRSGTTAEAVIKQVVYLCLPYSKDAAQLAEQRLWQAHISKVIVDDHGMDDRGVFLLGLANQVRTGYLQWKASRNQDKYIKQLADDKLLDLTPLLQAYHSFLSM